ncbi:MAG: type II secretion system protein [FCB group bacterium]|nr:type II secretion system protein [FCB group bacterium]MBL7029481.1 type II secretion system protein [Candidatus Neomarinimicrobiota bacterium]MBL7123070.1 type II secretion system protein [Candidatus Neomarinimicrobiota bacterium]
MKTNNNKGFTLIELIMVIVILGILAAVAVPKFFSITTEAHTKNKQAVVGNIRSGLQLFAANKLVKTGTRSFPAVNDAFLDSVLDEIPDGWTPTYAAVTDTVTYDADGTKYLYDGAGSFTAAP